MGKERERKEQGTDICVPVPEPGEREPKMKIRSGTKGTGTETQKTFRNGERIFRPVPFLAHLCFVFFTNFDTFASF